MIPLISILSLQIGALLSGSLYIEAVFSWPGAGGLLAEAVSNRDFPLVQGLAFLGGLITIVFSLLADVLVPTGRPSDSTGLTAMTTELGTSAEPIEAPSQRGVRAALRPLLRSPGGMFGAIVVLLLVMLAVFAPLIAPHDPLKQSLRDANTPPFWSSGGSTKFLLGTDTLGRDILSRLIYGSRVSLTVAVGGVAIAATLGMMLGLIAGYRGGRIDRIIVGGNDLLLSVPYLLLVVVIAAVVGKSLVNVILIFGFTDIPIFVRVTRGEVLKLSESTFVEAARSVGVHAPANPVVAPRPQSDRTARNARHVRDVLDDPVRGWARVPRPVGAAEHTELGQHDQRRAWRARGVSMDLDRPGRGDRVGRNGSQPARRLVARRPRPSLAPGQAMSEPAALGRGSAGSVRHP